MYAFWLPYSSDTEFQNEKHLDLAIFTMDHVLALTPDGDASQASYYFQLGALLVPLRNFDPISSDFDRTMITFECSVAITLDSGAAKSDCLIQLGDMFWLRFGHTSCLTDIGRALWAQNDAVCLTPESNANKPDRLDKLAHLFLFDALNIQEKLVDINNAIPAQGDAARLTPYGNANRAPHLHKLGVFLMHRFGFRDELVDINKANSAFKNGLYVFALWRARLTNARPNPIEVYEIP